MGVEWEWAEKNEWFGIGKTVKDECGYRVGLSLIWPVHDTHIHIQVKGDVEYNETQTD